MVKESGEAVAGGGEGGQGKFGSATGAIQSQSSTYQAMSPISDSQNPYSKYNHSDGDSVDDGINLGENL